MRKKSLVQTRLVVALALGTAGLWGTAFGGAPTEAAERGNCVEVAVVVTNTTIPIVPFQCFPPLLWLSHCTGVHPIAGNGVEIDICPVLPLI
jgi:hypothetical protein